MSIVSELAGSTTVPATNTQFQLIAARRGCEVIIRDWRWRGSTPVTLGGIIDRNERGELVVRYGEFARVILPPDGVYVRQETPPGAVPTWSLHPADDGGA